MELHIVANYDEKLLKDNTKSIDEKVQILTKVYSDELRKFVVDYSKKCIERRINIVEIKAEAKLKIQKIEEDLIIKLKEYESICN